MVEVQLTLTEMCCALSIAGARIIASESRGLNHASTYKRNMMTRIIEETVGALAEMAVGKMSGEYFVPSVNTFHRVPDCFGNTEVRGTSNANGRLIVRDNDADDRKYIFATVEGENVKVWGWILGVDAKKKMFLDNPNGYRESWFVDRKHLNDMWSFQIVPQRNINGVNEHGSHV